ncbi:hypothetical protein [Natronolimnobius baerhuensis]|uniref:Uncharacterized protein n=1 Tax=Natronolimnobius baerhuensis TaxID=253108 RepID=A0A202ECU8_9EURY|nr:hypothetical protein [Natronolimnobius baerhuensis]OVE86096.1 hypothetical protein B2G88_04705 [Natronolimnobius baerhuensis]
MSCPYLEYRQNADGHSFDTARAYCMVANQFVQPMRADICADRYDLAHDRNCEIFLEHADSERNGDATDGEPS